jgi:hypothetical protein
LAPDWHPGASDWSSAVSCPVSSGRGPQHRANHLRSPVIRAGEEMPVEAGVTAGQPWPKRRLVVNPSSPEAVRALAWLMRRGMQPHRWQPSR